MTEALPGALAARPPQIAVGPLNTIDKEDIKEGATAFDKWLREISNGYVTLERLTTVAGTVPVLSNIIALGSVLVDIVDIVNKYIDKKAEVTIADWAGVVIDLMGVVPGVGGPARVTLRPTLHLVRQKLAQTGANLGEALVVVLVEHMNDRLAGELEAFAEGAIDRLDGMLADCANLTDKLVDDLIDILKRCAADKPLFDIQTLPPSEKDLYEPTLTARLNRMLAAAVTMAENGAKETANAVVGVAAMAADRLNPEGRKKILAIIPVLNDLKGTFRAQLRTLANEQLEKSIK